MKVYRITKETGQPLILGSMEDWTDMLGGPEYEEVGDKYAIEIVEMTEKDYENLSEWAGF